MALAVSFVYINYNIRSMSNDHNGNRQDTDEEYAAKMQEAFKKDRFGGWPVIISLGGLLAVALRLVFADIDDYISVGNASIYLWELGLIFFVGTISFMPVTITDAKRIAAGSPHLTAGAYWKMVAVYFAISIALTLLAGLLVYLFFL